jgi:hypothetical protein
VGPPGNKNFLASLTPTNSEPYQRTDISTQPLGRTILEVLNCGFNKIKDEKVLLYADLCIIIFVIGLQ